MLVVVFRIRNKGIRPLGYTGDNACSYIFLLSHYLFIGKFSLASLVIKLVSGMGLLTLTATIVDTLALYILPDRFRYRGYVYETSPFAAGKEIKQD